MDLSLPQIQLQSWRGWGRLREKGEKSEVFPTQPTAVLGGRLGRMGSGREMEQEVLRRMGLWFLHRKHQKVFCTAAFSTEN